MTALEEFYESYLHYSVAQRLFEDTCRQLVGFKGSVDERQQLVDETLRLAICVSDNIDDTESLIPDVLEYLHSENGDPDIIHAISLITNNLKEDRARANSYSNFVTYRRIGNRARKPRRPQIANPFIPIVDDGPVEAIVISPKDPENVVRMTMDDAPVDITSVRSEGELDGRHSVEDLPAEDGDDVEDDSAVTEDDDTKDTHESDEGEVEDESSEDNPDDADDSEDDSDDSGEDETQGGVEIEEERNPLAVESERIMEESATSKGDDA